MLDQVTSMRVFLRVHAEGSFSGAARAMHLSQTMVGKHISGLEQRLGAQLFRRSTRSLTLTEAGCSYLRSSQQILAEIDQAEDLVRAGQTEPRGHLRMTAPVSFGTRCLAPLMPEFSKLYPHVTVELGLHDNIVNLVQDGWDIAVRFGRLPDSNLRSRALAPCRIVVCASPAYLERHGTPRMTADLARHNCIGFTINDRMGIDHWSFGPNAEISVPISGNLRSNTTDALRAAAVAGAGIASLPTYLVGDELNDGRLVLIELEHAPTPIGEISAVFADDRHMPLKTRNMIEFLVARFGRQPPWETAIDLPAA